MVYITLSDVISNRICDNHVWRDMTEEERTEALEQIKTMLLETCRKNSQVAQAIRRMSLTNLPENIGIYERVTVHGYYAGQSYPEELRYVKNTIKRQC